MNDDFDRAIGVLQQSAGARVSAPVKAASCVGVCAWAAQQRLQRAGYLRRQDGGLPVPAGERHLLRRGQGSCCGKWWSDLNHAVV